MIHIKQGDRFIDFEISFFPDKTSQAWKFEGIELEGEEVNVIWYFQNEAELVNICQIGDYLSMAVDNGFNLVVPFLPYGRQDKDISSYSTFALTTFKGLIHSCGYNQIISFDVHGESGKFIKSVKPTEFFKSVLNHEVICFPDKGAKNRYEFLTAKGIIVADKVRNQQTGEITRLDLDIQYWAFSDNNDLSNKRVLIVDDICDGGATFINVAKELKKWNPVAIDLCVSHGIFSRGKQVLFDAGINKIYTTNSLLSNREGYNVLGDLLESV